MDGVKKNLQVLAQVWPRNVGHKQQPRISRQTDTDKDFHDRYAGNILRHKQQAHQCRRAAVVQDTHLRSGNRRRCFCIGVVGWRLCACVRHLCLLGTERGEWKTVTYTDIQSNDKRSNKPSSTEARRPWSPVSYCCNFNLIYTAAMKYLCHLQGVVSELLFMCPTFAFLLRAFNNRVQNRF